MAMDNVDDVTTALGNVVLDAGRGDEQLDHAAVLESFAQCLLRSHDPVVREAFLDAALDVLRPRSDDPLNAGRLAFLADSPLPMIPPFLRASAWPSSAAASSATQILHLIAAHGDARDVALALNGELEALSERMDPSYVSENEDEDEAEEGVEWDKVGVQLALVLDMYAAAIPRLKTQRSTPTLLALLDVLVPLLMDMPGSSPGELAESLSRTLLPRVARLAEAVWRWSQSTSDKGGQQRSLLTELVQGAVMVFGPSLNAALTPRWFLARYPRYAGLHAVEGWEEGQGALDVVLDVCASLGLGRKDFLDGMVNTSSLTPHSTIASFLLSAASIPGMRTDGKQEAEPVLLKETLADCMPVLSIGLAGSAVDAGAALAWSLVTDENVSVEFDQATFLLELVMPLIQIAVRPTTRLALSKLIGAIIAAAPVADQPRLFEQLAEPANPFEAIRVLTISLLREALTPKDTKLLTPAMLDVLGSTLFTYPPDRDSPLTLNLAQALPSMWPAWLSECAAFAWFLIERDAANATGIRSPKQLTEIRGWLRLIEGKVKGWKKEAEAAGTSGEEGAEVEMVLDRLQDSVTRALAAVEGASKA